MRGGCASGDLAVGVGLEGGIGMAGGGSGVAGIDNPPLPVYGVGGFAKTEMPESGESAYERYEDRGLAPERKTSGGSD